MSKSELANAVAEYLQTVKDEAAMTKQKQEQAKSIASMLPPGGNEQCVLGNRYYVVRRFGQSITVRRGDPVSDPDTHESADKPLHQMTVPQLVNYAEQHGIEIDKSAKKAAIIDAINSVQSAE